MRRFTSTLKSSLRVAGVVGCLVLASALVTGCADDQDGSFAPEMAAQGPNTDLSFDPAMVVEGRPGEVVLGPGMESVSVVYHYFESGNYYPGEDLKLEISDDIELKIDEDSIDHRVVITAEVWVKKTDSHYDWVQFDFNPSMGFDTPVELEISRDIAQTFMSNGEYVLWYLNESTDEWQIEDIGELDDDEVDFELNHFSKWALAD